MCFPCRRREFRLSCRCLLSSSASSVSCGPALGVGVLFRFFWGPPRHEPPLFLRFSRTKLSLLLARLGFSSGGAVVMAARCKSRPSGVFGFAVFTVNAGRFWTGATTLVVGTRLGLLLICSRSPLAMELDQRFRFSRGPDILCILRESRKSPVVVNDGSFSVESLGQSSFSFPCLGWTTRIALMILGCCCMHRFLLGIFDGRSDNEPNPKSREPPIVVLLVATTCCCCASGSCFLLAFCGGGGGRFFGFFFLGPSNRASSISVVGVGGTHLWCFKDLGGLGFIVWLFGVLDIHNQKLKM